MAKRILVTGGAGFIGASIVRSLVSSGYKVRVLDNLQRGDLKRLSQIDGKFEFVQCDIRDSKEVIAAAKDCHSIIHLAYVNGTKFFYSNPDLVLDIGIKGMVSILEACKLPDMQELFLASSSEVYQNPATIPTPEDVPLIIPDAYNPRYSYGGGKIISELLAIHNASKSLKRTVIFRPHNVYGPDMGTEHVIPELIIRLNKLKNGNNNFAIQGSGKETRSYMFIDDFTSAFNLLFTKGKNLNTYNIGNNDEINSLELAKKIAKILNKKIDIKPGELLKGSTPRRCPDISKITRLGYKKKVDLEEGILKTADWYLK